MPLSYFQPEGSRLSRIDDGLDFKRVAPYLFRLRNSICGLDALIPDTHVASTQDFQLRNRVLHQAYSMPEASQLEDT